MERGDERQEVDADDEERPGGQVLTVAGEGERDGTSDDEEDFGGDLDALFASVLDGYDTAITNRRPEEILNG